MIHPTGDVTLGSLEGHIKASLGRPFDLEGCGFTDAYGLVALMCFARQEADRLGAADDRGYQVPVAPSVQKYHERMRLPATIVGDAGLQPDARWKVYEWNRQDVLCELTRVTVDQPSQVARLAFDRLRNADPDLREAVNECLVEACCNVADHAGTDAGYAAAQVYRRGHPDEHIVIGIGDAGIGIRASLEGKAEGYNDRDLLDAVLAGGLTRTDDVEGRGYGLHNVVMAVAGLGGSVTVRSGAARAVAYGSDRVNTCDVPHVTGTFVGVRMPLRA